MSTTTKTLHLLFTDKDPADPLSPEERKETNRINRRGFAVLYRKELADHLGSLRFCLLYALFFLVCAAGLYGASKALSEASRNAQAAQMADQSFCFLKLFTTNGSGIYSFATFLNFLGPVFGIMLGFDAINNEQAQGTLNRLAAQPIYRDTIINAKFAAGASFVFLLMAVVYISVWLAVSMLFSVLSRHAATSALISVALWLFLTMFSSLVANAIASVIYPAAKMQTDMDVIRQYRLSEGLNRVSPYYMFSEITSVLMDPNVRSLDIMSLLEYQNGAIVSYLSLGQSLLQIWPHLVAMIAESVLGFAASYIAFMKKEIRA